MAKVEITNVMRLLSSAGIEFSVSTYDPETTDGEEVAKLVGTDPDQTYKTLVTVGASKKNYVFVVPVNRELDLKKCAKAVSEKNIEMIPQKMLLPLTGYIHGGCSPVGLKKAFPVIFDSSCLAFSKITLSAGKRGKQITVSPAALISFLSATTAPLSREKAKPNA